jgi:hypothetical protein
LPKRPLPTVDEAISSHRWFQTISKLQPGLSEWLSRSGSGSSHKKNISNRESSSQIHAGQAGSRYFFNTLVQYTVPHKRSSPVDNYLNLKF